jgi:predicted PolB exonuclease-like 3'-5' exonuclease
MVNEIGIDIETIPGQGLRVEEAEIAKKLCTGTKAIKDMALSPWSGQIVCIGVSIDNKIATLANMPEKDILEAFWILMREKAKGARFVTFRGKKFDIPFITRRSDKLNVKKTYNISTRLYYNDQHFDVMEELTDHFTEKWLSLKEYCILHDIPTTDTVDGSLVYALWSQGNIKAIEEHCAEDVRSTMALYRRITAIS